MSGTGPSTALVAFAATIETFQSLFAQDTRHSLALYERAIEKVRSGDLFADDLEFWKRSLVRSFAAQVEGVCYQMRAGVAEAGLRGEVELSERKRGQLTEEKRHNTFFQNVRLALEWFPRAFGKTYTMTDRDPRWRDFETFKKLRDAITHPKSEEGFVVTMTDIESVEKAMSWFDDSIREVLVLCGVFAGPQRDVGFGTGRWNRLPRKTRDVWNSVKIANASAVEARGNRASGDADSRQHSVDVMTSAIRAAAGRIGSDQGEGQGE